MADNDKDKGATPPPTEPHLQPGRHALVHVLPYHDENDEKLDTSYYLGRLYIDGQHVKDFFGDTARRVKLAIKAFVSEPEKTTGPETITL